MTATAVQYETVIGLEVHAQLVTRSKMFCGCSADYAGADPNTHVCPVCLGLPGVLPVINEAAIEAIVLTGLALNCEILPFSKFDRKNYHYPDLMKGYQVSQYDLPVCKGGWLDIDVDGERRRIGVTRVHMEEDTARLLHRVDAATGQPYSLVDVNRSGLPLMEIVSEPDMRTPAEAREYLVNLRQILRYIGVSEANMEEGNFRCDANVSLRPAGQAEFGTKVEIKNMNSFRAVHDAIAFEMRRQAEVLDAGGNIVQETRGWVDDRHVTVSQRTKEYADDYRYFPEPDLPPMQFSRDFVERIGARLPELPAARGVRFRTLGLSDHEALTLTESRERADYFEALMAAVPGDRERAAKLAANMVLGDIARWSNATGREIDHFPVAPATLAGLVAATEVGAITGQVGHEVFDRMVETGREAGDIIEESGLGQLNASDDVRAIVRTILSNNEHAVADYRAGKAAALKFLVGQVMRETRGRANPQLAEQLLQEELN